MFRHAKTHYIIVFAAAVLAGGCSKPNRNGAPLDVTVHVRTGRDLGQPLGSLFEARDAEGRVIFGAGFEDIHSTYLRGNNRRVVFYYKSSTGRPSLTPIVKPFGSDRNGVRLYIDGDNLLAFHRVYNPVKLQKLNDRDAWTPLKPSWLDALDHLGGLQTVDNRRMTFFTNRILYDGREIYKSPNSGMYYYANGLLFIFHYETSQLFVREWSPDSKETVNIEEGPVWPVEGNPFAFGVYKDRVIFSTNVGNVYAYDRGNLHRIRENSNTSWQVYTMPHLYNDLLLGHYPSGSFYVYNGDGLSEFEPALPVPDGAGPDAREAQTAAVYCGDLYVGVWPWGELWRYDPDMKTWDFVARVFDTPAMRRDISAPYVEEMADKWDAVNYWGQRITSLVNYQNALYIGTMNKQGKPFRPDRHDFLDEAAVKQYGRVFRLEGNAQTTAPFTWKEETAFRFVCSKERLTVYQDNELLSQTPLGEEGLGGRTVAEIKIGTGIYGDFTGEVETAGE